MPSAASRRKPSPSGIAAQSSPSRTGASPHGPRGTIGRWLAATWMSRLPCTPSAPAIVAASSRSTVEPLRPWLGGERVALELGLHEVMGLPEQIDLGERTPVQATEEGDVRALHRRSEL